MTITEMIKALNSAMDDLGAVVSDLEDARDGDLDLEDVNTAFLSQAIRIAQEVQAALRPAA